MQNNHYRRLGVMAVLHFAAMYVLMYAMVDARDNIQHNLNQFYMAGLMTAAMLAIEVPLMKAMYRNKRLNMAIVGGAVLALAASFVAIRKQAAISDTQFLRSMIPHHAGAILMCENAAIRDPEILALCGIIIASQRAEIDQMAAKLRELGAR